MPSWRTNLNKIDHKAALDPLSSSHYRTDLQSTRKSGAVTCPVRIKKILTAAMRHPDSDGDLANYHSNRESKIRYVHC